MDEDLVTRLRKRAEIRRQIATRKSVQEGKPDRIADLLEEAANEIARLWAYEHDMKMCIVELPMGAKLFASKEQADAFFESLGDDF